MKDKNLASIIKALIFITAFVPFITLGSNFSFSFGKALILKIIIEIIFIFYLILIIKNKSYYPKNNIIFWLLAAFVTSYLFSSFLGINFYKSFWGDTRRMGGFITLLHFFIFFTIASSVLVRKDFLRFFKFSIIIAFFVALYGIGQKLDIGFLLDHGIRKPHGTIGNAALLAGYLLFNVFFALYFFISEPIKRNARFFYLVFIILGTIVIFLTTVRGAMLALFFGIFYFLFTYLPKRFKKLLVFIFSFSNNFAA